MEYIYDSPFSDVFRCDGDLDFHDYYYVSPYETDYDSYLYQVRRTGLEHSLPPLLEVERKGSAQYCEIFCILSGKGYLEYRDRTYELRRNQLVLLADREPHKYWCDSQDPMGKVWLEIYGGDAGRIIRHLIDLNGPVIEGALFADICAQLCLIQQRLMVNEYYQPSLEIYRVLLTLLQTTQITPPTRLTQESKMNFLLVEAYINAHISQRITNAQLADVCGISPKHFIKVFKQHYRMTPQDFIMHQRVRKAQFTLLHTNLSVDAIAESLGFCNTSHFIRRFTEVYGTSPAKYRRLAVTKPTE